MTPALSVVIPARLTGSRLSESNRRPAHYRKSISLWFRMDALRAAQCGPIVTQFRARLGLPLGRPLEIGYIGYIGNTAGQGRCGAVAGQVTAVTRSRGRYRSPMATTFADLEARVRGLESRAQRLKRT